MVRIKNILKYIATIFLVLLVSLCIYTFVVTDILKKDYVNVFGYSYFVVATGSMSGTIEVDDIIFVKITHNVRENDIITFQNDDGDLITHRLVTKSGSKYITKGDVNNVTDDPITKNQIIGKVVLIVSPSFILKSIAIFLIVFIFLALVNFDSIIKKFIVKDNNNSQKLPDDLFANPNRKYDEPSTGLTVTISIDEMEKLNKAHEEQAEKEENIEVLDFDEYLFPEDKVVKKKDTFQKETIDLVISILKCKKTNAKKAKMNKKWITKYQYVYKICLYVLNNQMDEVRSLIEKPTFDEIYDYDLERVGLTETIRNRIYELPLYSFLRLLTYCILYNDDEMFDGIYKILKYKVAIDKGFKQLNKNNSETLKQLKILVSFMKKVSNKFDNKNVFELEKIERMIKIGNY